jgi:hypothetical protein
VRQVSPNKRIEFARCARPTRGVRRHGNVACSSKELGGRNMKRFLASVCGAAAALSLGASAYADCVAKGFLEDDFPHNPIYEVVSCGRAEPVVELLKQSNPTWFGTFSYAEGDVVVTVRAANDDARKLMWGDIEYWYYPSGCGSIREGMRFVRPELRELCCDVGPVRNLPCGVGGKQLLTLEG